MRVKRREITTYVITALLYVWLIVSFIEVVTHNLDSNYTYNSLNAFKLFMELFKEVRG